MSNPIYDMMKQVEIQKDIAEIHAILSGYENVNCPIRFNGLPVSDERCGQFG